LFFGLAPAHGYDSVRNYSPAGGWLKFNSKYDPKAEDGYINARTLRTLVEDHSRDDEKVEFG